MSVGDGSSDEALRDAWQRFCELLAEAGQLAFKDSVPPDGRDRVNALRFLTRNLGQAFALGLETADPAFPLLHYFTTPTMKLGGDVADFTYRQAWIDGAHEYRLVGRRGTARWLNIAVQGERPATIPGTDWPSLHEPFGDLPQVNLFAADIDVAADGSFEVFVGGPPRPRNWLATTPTTRKLFIREAFDGWDETPTPMTIERLGIDAPPPMPDPERMIDAIGWAGEFLATMMRDWPDHPRAYSRGVVDADRPNEFPEPASARPGDTIRGRLAANLVWRLAPDEALLVEMPAGDGFWIFALGDVFHASLDFLYRPVSYTPARTAIDGDGVVRLVLAHTDPGVHNWLDTQGLSTGNLTFRFVQGDAVPGFRTRVVPFDRVAAELPTATRRTTPDERARQLRTRFRSVQARYAGSPVPIAESHQEAP